MANKITGRVDIYWNGKKLLNKAGAKISGVGISGLVPTERKAVMTDVGIAGYVEEVVTARCEVTIVDRSDQMLSDLAAVFEDGTIIFQSTGSGKTYTMKEATCLGNLEVTAGEGDSPIVFEGKTWVETVRT